MANTLKNYITKERKKGFSDKEIKKALSKVGYSKEEVAGALGPEPSEPKVSKPIKPKPILFILIGVLIVVVLGFLFFGQFQREEVPPRIMSSDDLNENIALLMASNEEYYKDKYINPVIRLKGCLNDCNFFNDSAMVETCVDFYNLFTFFRSVAGGNCPGDLQPLDFDLPDGVLLDANVLCESITTNNCVSGGVEQEICEVYLDRSQCGPLTRYFADSEEDCLEDIGHIAIAIEAIKEKNTELCDTMKGAGLGHLSSCRGLAKDNCEEVYNNFLRDVAVLILKKEVAIENEGLCETISIPELLII